MFHEALERAVGITKHLSQPGVAKLFPGRVRNDSPAGAMANDPGAALYGSVQRLLIGRSEGRIIHVTAATHGEGVSTIARALAERAYAAGHRRVLLLNDFAPDHSAAALNQNLVARVSRGDTVEASNGDSSTAHLLTGNLIGPVGTGAPDPKTLQQTYIECRKKFELVIIDCSPASDGRYFELIPSAVDGIILVVRAESVRPAVVLHCKETIEQHGGTLLSVVLNRARYYIPRIIYRLI